MPDTPRVEAADLPPAVQAALGALADARRAAAHVAAAPLADDTGALIRDARRSIRRARWQLRLARWRAWWSTIDWPYVAELAMYVALVAATVVLGVAGHPFWALLPPLTLGATLTVSVRADLHRAVPSPVTVAVVVSGWVATALLLMAGLGLLALLAGGGLDSAARALATIVDLVTGLLAGGVGAGVALIQHGRRHGRHHGRED